MLTRRPVTSGVPILIVVGGGELGRIYARQEGRAVGGGKVE